MANIIYRGSKPTNKNAADGPKNGTGAPLSNGDIDGNFFTLDADKLDKATTAAQSVVGPVTFSGNVVIGGDLTVSGDTTTLNVATLDVEDKNIVLASGATTDPAADGGGITLKGASNKTIIWDVTNTNWTSSEHWNIANGKSFKINNTSVLNSTTLGSTVVSSSLTKLGTAVGFVKSDASGNLTSDNSTYSVSTHQTHYIGTTQVQGSAVAQAVAGVSSLTNSAGNALTITTTDNAGTTGALSLITGNATSSNGNSGSISITSGNGHGSGDSGSISISTGSGGASANGNSGGITISTGAGTTGSGNLIIKTGDSDVVGTISITPGICDYPIESGAGSITIRAGQSTANNVTAGHVYVAGGNNTNASNGTGGNVYIDGGSGPTNSGVVIIGSSNSLAIDIGSSSNTTTIKGTVKLANVGTSGFVKLGAGGQLSADTNTYLTGNQSISLTGDVTGSGATSITTTIANGAVATAKIADSAVTEAKIGAGAATIAKGGVGFTTYAKGDILYASAANTLSKLTVGSDGQVLKLASGVPSWAADNDTTYTASTGLTLTGTAFSVSFGNTSTTACVGNDARLSDARTPTAHTHAASDITSGTLAFARLPTVYVGTTAIQSSSANQAVSGVTTLTLAGTTPTITTTDGNTNLLISTIDQGPLKAGDITVKPGSGNTAGRGALYLGGGDANGNLNTGGAAVLRGGNFVSSSSNGNGGNVIIVGGYGRATTGSATGGAVYIDGGLAYVGAVGTPTLTNGTVYIGTRNTGSGLTGFGDYAATKEVIIGGSGIPVNLPGVGTSGFVKLGANGALSADTNSYSVTGHTHAASDITSGTFAFARLPSLYIGTTAVQSSSTNQSLTGITNITATGSITASSASFGNNVDASIFYEYNNTAFYLDLAATGTSLYTAGSIIAGGNLTANSDRRLKTDIRVIENALDKVHKITGVTFDRTDNPDVGRQTGVIAQEVKEVLPEAVTGNEESYYSVAYGNMVGLLIEAIKELNAKVEDLQKQLSNK